MKRIINRLFAKPTNPEEIKQQEKLTALQLEGWTIVKHGHLPGTIMVEKKPHTWVYEFGGKTKIEYRFFIDQAYEKQFNSK